MYRSVSNNCDFQKEYQSGSPTPSAPPCPPPPPAPPLVSSNFQERTDIPFHATNYPKMTRPIIPDPLLAMADTNTTYKNSLVPWSTGLCDCCNDVNSCCLTCCCPCITFGRIAEMVDRGSTSCGVSGALYTLIMCLTGCSCLYSCFYRSKLRGQFFLEESPCTDCCVHCCCEGCALCQEYRELKNRGFDMSIGWHGNLERQKRLAAVAPAIQGGMTR